MQFAILGILVLLLIGFSIVVWKASPGWYWYNIVAVSVTMLLGMIFLFPVAGVLQSRAAWHQVKEDLETRLEDKKQEQKELKYGDPADPASGDGVLPLAQELAQVGVEAGRRWRHLRMSPNSTPEQVLLVQMPSEEQAAEGVPPAEPAEEGEGAEGEAAAAAPLIPEGMVVYGFAERPHEGVSEPIPRFFLGEFQVSASEPNQVALEPTGPLEPAQRQAISGRQAVSWSLYELLPLDGHRPFVKSEPDDDALFGEIDKDAVKQLLGNRVSEQTLRNYLRDGSRATQDDPPLSRWVKIEFTTDHSIVVDSPDERGALDGGFFDGSGRAVDSRLQRGEDNQVEFNDGDQVVVKEEVGRELVNEGVARLLDTYYVRPLNDYRFVLRRIRLRLTEMSLRQEELEFEQNMLKEAVDATVSTLTANQAAKLKLEQDLAQTQLEKKTIQEYQQQLQQKLEETRNNLVRLYRSNQQLENELSQIHRAVKQRLDAVTLNP